MPLLQYLQQQMQYAGYLKYLQKVAEYLFHLTAYFDLTAFVGQVKISMIRLGRIEQ
jgi:hypothetical protein